MKIIASPLDCERLIHRMLHLDPSKRIPLSSVLKHNWMRGDLGNDMPTNNLRVFGSSDNLIWNDQVQMAIQSMNYNVDACKQVSEYCVSNMC